MLEVVIVVEEKSIPLRSFISVGNGKGYGSESRFRGAVEVLSDEALYMEAVRKVWFRLQAIRQEYQTYAEFGAIWHAMDVVAEELSL